MKWRILTFSLLTFCFLSGAFEVRTVNPGIIAMGEIMSVNSIFLNPTGIDNENGFRLEFGYTNLYSLKGLKLWEASGGIKRDMFGVAVRFQSTGYSTYHESVNDVGFSYNHSELFTIAVNLSYYAIGITGYGEDREVGISVGSNIYPTQQLKTSLIFRNVNAPKIAETHESLPQSFAFGFGWFPSNKWELEGELYKDTLYPFMTRFGISFLPVDFAKIMLGIQLNPDRYSGGIAFSLSKYSVIIATRSHMNLPHTLYFGCSLDF